MLIYLSGPMTGIPEHNYPRFHAAAADLREQGFEVINPAEHCPDESLPWSVHLRRDIQMLCRCDTVAVLDGWRTSKGAGLEVHIARELGMQVLRASTLEPVPPALFDIRTGDTVQIQDGEVSYGG